MATVILGTIGQIYGGPLGRAAGEAIGGFIDRNLLFPGANVENDQGRLSDLAVQSSAYGAPIPFCFGNMRLSGNVIWSTGLIERRMSESSRAGGKGGGGGRVTNTTYSYSASFAVALCARPIKRIGKIWADGKLIQHFNGRLTSGGFFRVYTGDEDQSADPVMQTSLGVGQVPAYRGLAYVVFEEFELAEFANRLPNLTFEVVADEGNVLVSIIADDLANFQGIPAMDTGELSHSVVGYATNGAASLRQVLEDLAAFTPASMVERGRSLILRDLPQSSFVVPYEDLGAQADGEEAPELERERQQDWELPSEALVRYLDPARDYQGNVQRARRLHVRQANVREQVSAIAVAASGAKRAAERLLNTAWSGRESYAFSLPLPWVVLEGGDYIRLEGDGADHPLLLGERLMRGFTLRVNGNRYDPQDALGDSTADAGTALLPIVQTQGVSHLKMLDLPRLPGDAGDSPGFYAAVAGDNDGWRIAAVFESLDAGISYSQRATAGVPVTMGDVIGVLPPASPHLWDEVNILRVTLLNADAELASRPALALLNGANAALVGEEVIQFRDAILMSDGSYELRGLLRGRLGTEAAISSHQTGESFVLLDRDALVELPTTLGQAGQERLYKAVGPQDIFDDIAAQPFTYQARALRPLSPVHISAVRQLGGDIALSWKRRSRLGAEWIDGADVPLGEEVERYEADILNANGTVIRTISISNPALIYTTTQQSADFGGAVDELRIALYQLSNAVGRGAPAERVFSF